MPSVAQLKAAAAEHIDAICAARDAIRRAARTKEHLGAVEGELDVSVSDATLARINSSVDELNFAVREFNGEIRPSKDQMPLL